LCAVSRLFGWARISLNLSNFDDSVSRSPSLDFREHERNCTIQRPFVESVAPQLYLRIPDPIQLHSLTSLFLLRLALDIFLCLYTFVNRPTNYSVSIGHPGCLFLNSLLILASGAQKLATPLVIR
jgi:hypothetical protein